MTNAIYNQNGFRGKTDLATPTYIAAENVDFSIDHNNSFRVRIEAEVTNAKAVNNAEFELWYSRNSGTWTQVLVTDTYLRPALSIHFADGDIDSVNELTSSSLTFTAGELDENGVCGDGGWLDFAGTDHVEAEYCIAIQAAASSTDTFDLELRIAGVLLDGYTRRPQVTYSVSGGVDIEVPVGTLAISGLVPTVATPVNIDIPVAALAVTGLVPTAGIGININVPVAFLVATGLTPTIATPVNIDVPAASLTATGLVPAVATGADIDIEVPVGSLAVTGLVPTAAVSDNINIDVPVASLAVTGLVPTAGIGVNVIIPVGTLAVTGLAPTIATTANINIDVPVAALATTGLVPTVFASDLINIEVPVAALAVTGLVPTAGVGANINVPAGALTVAGLVPTVTATANINIDVPVASLVTTGHVPDVQAGADVDIDVPVAALVLAAYIPIAATTANVDIDVPAAAIAIAGYVPAVETTASVNITVPVASLTTTGYPPTIVGGVGANIDIPTAALTLTGLVPIIAVLMFGDIISLESGFGLEDGIVNLSLRLPFDTDANDSENDITPSTETGAIIYPAHVTPQVGSGAVQLAEATTNIAENPSIETNTTGWDTIGANTIERVSEQAKFGNYSLKCIYQNNLNLATFTITLTAVAHSYGIWVYVPADYDGTNLGINFATDFVGITGCVSGDIDMNKTNQWQFVVAFGTPDAGDLTGTVRVKENGVLPTVGKFIYIDGIQVEAKAYPTPYCDGSLGEGHTWSGTPHASTSSRTETNLQYDDLATAISGKTKLTFAGWYQPVVEDANCIRYIFTTMGADNNNRIIVAIPSSAIDPLRLYINGDWRTSYTGPTNITDKVFWAATLDFDADEYVLYVYDSSNGTLYSESSSASLSSPILTTFDIGQNFSVANHANGWLDELIALDYALTADEVGALYTLGDARKALRVPTVLKESGATTQVELVSSL